MDERNDLPADDEMNESSDSATPIDGKHALAQFHGNAKDVIAKYSHCALCGANLHFSHVTDFSRNLTQETARCPECGVKSRQVLHRLQ